jgi:hypothetical protein
MKYGVWCQPRDGSKNGTWYSYNGIYVCEKEEAQKIYRQAVGLATWYYEVREYHE